MKGAMEIIEQVDEGAMLLAWAEAERGGMANHGVVLSPSPTPDQARRALEEARGTRDLAVGGIFGGWPDDVVWFRAVVTVREIGDFWHCGYWTFRCLTNESRFPRDAANAIANNTPTEQDHNEEIVALRRIAPEIADAIREGEKIEPLIAVALDKTAQPVIAEGNKRSIAYQLVFPLDEEIEILFGTSPNMASWRFYNFA